MEGPDFTSAAIDPRKLTHYLLSETHLEGAAKAAFFNACGFGNDSADALARALRRQAASTPAVSSTTDFGVKYIVDGPLLGLDGRTRLIRSVWIVETGAGAVRFVTAYPLETRRVHR